MVPLDQERLGAKVFLEVILLASHTSPPAASHAGVVTNTRLDFQVKNITCKNPANIASLASSKAKSVVLSKWRGCVQVDQVRSEHTAFHGTFISFFLLLAPAQGTDPKKCDPRLLRRSNFEGSVPWAGARRKKKEKKKEETRFGQSCWRGTRGPRKSAIVLPCHRETQRITHQHVHMVTLY